MDLDTLHKLLKIEAERKTFERWRFFVPVPKQEEFLFGGAHYPERMLMAGNGNGKTECAAFEVSRHLTGEYPTWWQGYRFNKPIRAWAAGTSGVAVREAAQTKLCGVPGDPEAFGTGFIPKEAILGSTTGRSAPNSIDSMTIRHVSGGVSRLVFKTYEQERQHWQGADLDLLWYDEEPPMEIYTEGLARLRGKGIALTTFTPLKGITELVKRFKYEEHADRLVVYMRLADANFLNDEAKQRLVAMYPAHEREARINGMPMMGEGAVFSSSADDLMEPAVPLDAIPPHWPRLWGIDFGIDHPFAAVLIAWDRDADRVHVLRTVRMKGAIPMQHAAAMRAIASAVPVAWPHDGTQREKGSGEPLASVYKKFGLKMLSSHATHPTGGYSFEAGILELETMMTEGRFKVDSTLTEWFEEYGSYHREKGLVVKKNDDLLSATRIAVMMRRMAKTVPFGQLTGKRDTQFEVAKDMNAWLADF